MNFNHDSGAIDTILTIDTSQSPPLGGQTNVLTIVGTGALSVPSGTTAQQPGTPAPGMLRWNTTSGNLEFYNNATWAAIANSPGTVTSVAATQPAAGLTISGSPITTSGTLTFALANDLAALEGISTSGIAVRSGTDTWVTRSLAGTAGNITIINSDGVSGNPTINLANVGTPVTGSFVKITTDAQGRVSATAPVDTADITNLADGTYVNISGDAMSSGANLTFSGGGTVTGLPAVAVNAGDAASKAYVDSVASGLDTKESVRAATTANITLSGLQTIDGVALQAGDRVLVKNQSSSANNGIYIASAGTWARATDADTSDKVSAGMFTFVEEGATFSETGWVLTTNDPINLGVTGLSFSQFSGAGTYQAGTGLTLAGNTFSLTSPVTTALGGTGLTTIGTANQILGVNAGASGLEYKSVTAGSGISVTPAAGSLTIANTGVLSVAGTTNQIAVTGSTGSVTFSLPGAVTLTTSLTISGLTANTMIYSGTAGLITSAGAATNGQILIGSTGAAPVRANITQGTGITVTNGAGSIAIANAGVTSLIAGTGIGVSGATGAVTVTNNGVTSVALAAPAAIFGVTGSPVTTTGTLTLNLATQTANTVFAGPTSGGVATPAFRSLVIADLPIALYRENTSTHTTPTATGANTQAFGDAASATITGSKVFANGRFATSGDAQHGVYILRNITSGNSTTELFLDGAGATQRLVLPNNSLFTFAIYIAARRTDSTGGGAGYKFEGVVRKDGTAGSTTIVGSVSKSILGETNVIWDASVVADTTNGTLRINVTGETGKTIRWVATVLTTEVTN